MAAHTVHLHSEILKPLGATAKTVFTVRDRNGAYTTNKVHGARASSTCSYLSAASALAAKLHPHGGWVLRLLTSEQGLQVFELELMQ
jgi:hypothetical protein